MIKEILKIVLIYIFQILLAIMVIVYLIVGSRKRTMVCNRVTETHEVCYITNLFGKD